MTHISRVEKAALRGITWLGSVQEQVPISGAMVTPFVTMESFRGNQGAMVLQAAASFAADQGHACYGVIGARTLTTRRYRKQERPAKQY